MILEIVSAATDLNNKIKNLLLFYTTLGVNPLIGDRVECKNRDYQSYLQPLNCKFLPFLFGKIIKLVLPPRLLDSY